jgi:hypothetical protein
MSLTPMAPSCSAGVTIAALAMVTLVAIVGIVAMVIVKTHTPTASEQAPCQPVCTAAKPTPKPAVCKAPP